MEKLQLAAIVIKIHKYICYVSDINIFCTLYYLKELLKHYIAHLKLLIAICVVTKNCINLIF